MKMHVINERLKGTGSPLCKGYHPQRKKAVNKTIVKVSANDSHRCMIWFISRLKSVFAEFIRRALVNHSLTDYALANLTVTNRVLVNRAIADCSLTENVLANRWIADQLYSESLRSNTLAFERCGGRAAARHEIPLLRSEHASKLLRVRQASEQAAKCMPSKRALSLLQS